MLSPNFSLATPGFRPDTGFAAAGFSGKRCLYGSKILEKVPNYRFGPRKPGMWYSSVKIYFCREVCAIIPAAGGCPFNHYDWRFSPSPRGPQNHFRRSSPAELPNLGLADNGARLISHPREGKPMKLKLLACLVGSVLLLTLAARAPAAEKGILWDGRQWTQASTDGKIGYIWGVGNMADFEVASSRGRSVCVSRAFVDSRKNQTVLQVVQTVDQFYKENPGKLDTAVIEVILRRCTTAVCPPETGGGEKKK